MTREMLHSDLRGVIIGLSWPRDQSVNAGIDKDSYLYSNSLLWITLSMNLRKLVEVPIFSRLTSAVPFVISRWTLGIMTSRAPLGCPLH